MPEIKKFDLGSEPVTAMTDPKPSFSSSTMSNHKGFPKKKVTAAVIVLGLLFVIVFFGIILPAQRVYSSANKTHTQAQKAWAGLKTQNINAASDDLAKTKIALTQTQKDLDAMSYLRFVPLVNLYYNDADHLMKAGSNGLNAGTIVLESIKPYADVLGLKGQGSFVMGSAEDRIKLAVMTMGKITPRIDEVASSLVMAQKELDQVDPNHYPGFMGGDKIRKQLTQVQTLADGAISVVEQARPLIKVLPALLGEQKEKKYLVLFQNDKELRPTGGFITAYAVFRIDKGIIHVDKSDDIYALDNSRTRTIPAPAPILKYLPKVPNFNIRDSNLSPDFEVSMDTFRSMYKDSTQKVDIDGIIALDTHVLVSVIKILDDEVIAGGIKFNTQMDKRCNCPQVIYVLEDNISRPVNYVKTARKDLLGTLLYAIMEKALKSSPKLYWGALFQDMVTEINEKHILVDLNDESAQGGVRALNAAGQIKAFEGDYLHVNDANLGGAKSNMYVTQAVNQDYQITGDGSVTKTITINYKNPQPPSDCDLERGGLCLNATLRDWVRLYVPKGSQLVDSKGSEVKVTTSEDLGKTVFEGFITVNPKGTATYTLTYKLPFKVASGSPLPLLIQKQPGTDMNEYTVKVNGKTIEKFALAVDKEMKLVH